MGVGIFGLLSTSILGEIGHSLTRASDRYIYTVSVPDLYHSVGRQAVRTLKEEAKCELEVAKLFLNLWNLGIL